MGAHDSRPQPLLIVSNHGDIVGGGELSLLGLLETLDRSQWTPIVVTPTDGEVATRCRGLGHPTYVVPLPQLRCPSLSTIRSLMHLAKLVRLTGAKLIHANGSRAMFYAGLTGWWTSRPTIWHVRVADPDGLWDGLLGRMAGTILVNSQAVAQRFSGKTRAKVRCVYNGADLSKFFPRPPSHELRQALGLPEGCPVAMSVGRFVPYKGYGILLEAAAFLKRDLPNLYWVLVGDGPLREELDREIVRLKLSDRVLATGWRNDVPDLLTLCDLFVLPSLSEHFGRVLIEAMAMAKPVVATASGGVPEIVEHEETGHLVPPGNPQALANAVRSLCENRNEAERLGTTARRRVEREFSLSKHAQEIASIYQKTLGDLHGSV